LAAPLGGVQEWLAFCFKAPVDAPEVYPGHDVFIQLMKLKITHLGLEYYD
jgi:myo-inositol-1-phosphate synthase